MENIIDNPEYYIGKIYSEAYNRDPEFYTFWKSLESYKKTLAGSDATYSTNMDYFKYLYSPEGKR